MLQLSHRAFPKQHHRSEGKDPKVLAAANRSVDAGEIIFKVDTDHDGISDEDELSSGLNPNDPSDADGDNDGDGLSNADEIALGTNPNNTDSDGDGFSDAAEVQLGFNPLDPASHPQPGAAVVSIQVTPGAMGLNVNSLFGATPAQLTVTGVLSDGTTADLTRTTGTHYQSLDPSVALVDDFGSVVGVAPGATSINVSNGTLTAQTQIFVAATMVGQTGVIHLAGGGNAFKVDVSGAYAYIAGGSAGLRVVDVNDRNHPQLASTLDTPGEAKGVKVVGNRAYIADGPSGLQIVDVTNPASPILLGSVDTPGDARDVVVYGQRAYVADGSSGLQIIDVTSPQAPGLLGSLNVSGTVNGVDASGDFAVLAMGTDGVRIADVSNPASPLSLGSVATTDARDVKCAGAIAYVADVGFKVVDFSAPSAPLLVSSLPDFTSGDLFDVAIAGNLVFGADTFAFRITAPIIDVSNPAAATVSGYVSFLDFGGGSSGIAADDRFVYACTSSNALYIGQYFQPDDVTDIAPTIAITSPQNGQSIMEGAALNITADAADDVSVQSVTFMIDGQVVSTDTAALFRDNTHTVPLDLTSVIIAATAVDQAGNVGTAAAITFNVTPDPPPSVTITSPPEGITPIGTEVTIAAIASDNIGVERVELRVNGSLVFTTSATGISGFHYGPAPDVTSLNIAVTAFDNLGRSTTAVRTISFVFDRLPEINVITPSNGTQWFGGFTQLIIAEVTDADGVVAQVDFVEVVSGTEVLLQSFVAPPYTLGLLIAFNDSGERTFKIIATDNLGGTRTVSRTVTVIPDPPPTMSITSPAGGTELIEGQQFTAAADAQDNRSIDRVTFAINGVALLSVTAPPYSAVLPVPIGITNLDLQATAIDNFGQSTSATRSFSVLFNQPPSVTLTSPVDGAQIYGGETVTLAADASDDYGVAQVVFNVNEWKWVAPLHRLTARHMRSLLARPA